MLWRERWRCYSGVGHRRQGYYSYKAFSLEGVAMDVLVFVLMLAAFVLLLLAAFGERITVRFHFGWLGLACWALAVLIDGGLPR